MARFVDWWTKLGMATPAEITMVAEAAGVFVESGDYKIDTFDFGDGGPPADIQVTGTVVTAEGMTWLVYPASCQTEGWRAQPVERSDDTGYASGGVVPRQIGAACDKAEHILAALIPRPAGRRQ